MSSYLLSVQNAGKHFDNKVVLERISLNIQAGEIVALVGPSGSGKSTLMNTIMRSVELSDGAVLLDNKNIRDYRDNKEYAQKVGVDPSRVFYDYHYETVTEYIYPYVFQGIPFSIILDGSNMAYIWSDGTYGSPNSALSGLL